MTLPISYLAVVLIWSTTPLAIVWSTETMHPTMAVFLRMAIALAICLLLLPLLRIRLPWQRTAWRLYLYSSIGVFGGMSFSYLSAQYLASGLMSLVFGLAPIVSGVLERKILANAKFSTLKKLAFIIATIGLALVCADKIVADQDTWLGLIFIASGMFCFSLSGVLIKSIDISIHPVATTTGTLLLCTPLFALMWWLLDGTVPIAQWQQKTILAVAYLAIFGSLIGFIAYFYILQKLAATTVALVTLLTPVLAMTLGAWLNNETIDIAMVIGAALIITGLALYQFGDKLVATHIRAIQP